MMEETAPNAIVYVIDDDPAVRDSIGALLEAAGLTAHLFNSGAQFLNSSPPKGPGCILLDYSMPDMTGLDVLSELRRGGNLLPAIMITAHGDVDLAVAAMKAGAEDFIEKPWEKDALISTVKGALARNIEKQTLLQNRSRAQSIINSFTPREKDVFDELILGAANKEIARTLDISPRTVEVYRRNVLEKADASSVADLVRLAFAGRQLQA